MLPLAVLALPAAAGASYLLVRTWQRGPWRGARTRWPVVLCHGVMGFTELGVGKLKSSYFRGIPEHLEELGVVVHRPAVPPTASIQKRALTLAEFIGALPEKKVNIIAHSMGGLDARYAISQLGLAPRVASLTTIGTPHRGSPIADLGTALGDLLGLGKLLTFVGLGVDAFYDLTTERAAAFNLEVPDASGVHYFSVVCAVERGDPDLLPLAAASSKLLEKRVGPSDGMVPVESQEWGSVLERVRADHWAQIGWSKGFDAPRFYATLCKLLRARGL